MIAQAIQAYCAHNRHNTYVADSIAYDVVEPLETFETITDFDAYEGTRQMAVLPNAYFEECCGMETRRVQYV